jgi:hypothetical protein
MCLIWSTLDYTTRTRHARRRYQGKGVYSGNFIPFLPDHVSRYLEHIALKSQKLFRPGRTAKMSTTTWRLRSERTWSLFLFAP